MKKGTTIFDEEYKKLNKAQKEAVDTIEGPVMVIAGPGTGKTQVLSLRIANILEKTDTPRDGILCLTFTNSGVRAMRERLSKLIGPTASRITISTFHSFAASLIDEYYETLGLNAPPVLLDERDSVLLADNLLEENEWTYLRPRSGGAHNFRDLKSLISFLKRENINPDQFEEEVRRGMREVEKDPENISSRGSSKGSLKKEALDKIERYSRSLEAATFYKLYEETKREKNLVDYDDILELATKLVETSEDVRASIAERYLYVMVDEHQDSSGIQNKFLEIVWGAVEKPNLFVVGDDRQLIYGFGGASLSHFESFRENFPGTKLITLSANYRSTQAILDAADVLLSSHLSKEKLKSIKEGGAQLGLVQAAYQRDEILAAGLEIKERLVQGLAPEDCAILVPKNYQVRSAILALKDLGLPVASGGRTSFFSMPETQALLSLLRVINSPFDPVCIADVLLHPIFGLPTLETHRFMHEYGRKITLEKLSGEEGELGRFGEVMLGLVACSSTHDIYELIQEIGQKIFFARTKEHRELVREVECVRTMLHLALSRIERNPKIALREFVSFVERLEEYGEDVPVAVFSSDEGVRVMTLHASKGLEFEFVWVAHLDEKSLMKGKVGGFTLPEKLSAHARKKDEEAAKRELYVAITRAKSSCILSYALQSYSGGELELAKIVSELPQHLFERVSAEMTEKKILEKDPLSYVTSAESDKEENALEIVVNLVKNNYKSMSLSVTHLNNFFGCPWKWYFRNFLRLPEPEGETLLFGNFVHFLAEEVIKMRSVDIEELHEKMEMELDALRVHDESRRKRFVKDAKEVLTTLGKEILPHIASEARSEASLRHVDETTQLSITGKIDLLENMDGEGLRVTDFKTGRPKRASEIEKLSEDNRMSDYLRQLTMYSYLIGHQRKVERVISSRLVFLESKDVSKDLMYETEIGDSEKQLLEKDISDYDQLLKTGDWVNAPCHFKVNTFERECPYCELRKRLL